MCNGCSPIYCFLIFEIAKLKHRCWLVGWLCLTSHRQRGDLETAPHLLSLAKDVKLVFYTVPSGNRTPGGRVAVHHTTVAPSQLPLKHIGNSLMFCIASCGGTGYLKFLTKCPSLPIDSFFYIHGERNMTYT